MEALSRLCETSTGLSDGNYAAMIAAFCLLHNPIVTLAACESTEYLRPTRSGRLPHGLGAGTTCPGQEIIRTIGVLIPGPHLNFFPADMTLHHLLSCWTVQWNGATIITPGTDNGRGTAPKSI